MARRTPKKIIEIIMRHEAQRNAINQRSGMSELERVAALNAINSLMEDVLNIHNCYNGYRHVNSAGYPRVLNVNTYDSKGRLPKRDLILEASHQYFINN